MLYKSILMLLPLLLWGQTFVFSAELVESSEPASQQQVDHDVDVCIYSGNASGLIAALTLKDQGKSVVVIEPSRWLGGIVGGGIRSHTDCLYREDIGGWTRKFLELDIHTVPGAHHINQRLVRELWKKLINEHDILVVQHHRVGRTSSVHKKDGRITSVSFDRATCDTDGCPAAEPEEIDAITVKAKVFIDASYEGDLMARSGVTHTVGRESRKQYGETLAGQTGLRSFDIDPYVVPGNPKSGLLPMVDPEPYKPGEASRHMIAYNFRWQFSRSDQGHTLGKPSRYVPEEYELARRAMKVPHGLAWPSINYGRGSAISGGVPGLQADFPNADWPERAKIWRRWIDHCKTLHMLKKETKLLRKGDYLDSTGIPHQLYIRMARRMVGEHVMVQQDLMYQTDIEDSIGLGFYCVDIYPCRILAHEGKLASEGALFKWVSPGPYPIAYGSITPKKSECTNLLVPVCISASHIALSSIRMEPTYMLMSGAAGVAAAQAIDEGKGVQDIDRAALKKRLLAAGQVLQWDGQRYFPAGKRPRINPGAQHWKSHPEEYKNRPFESWVKPKSQ